MTKGLRITGFCDEHDSPLSSEPTAEEIAASAHMHCRGAVRNGIDPKTRAVRLYICQCRCHNIACPACLDCGQRPGPDQINPLTWTCIDGEACRTAQAVKRENSPFHEYLVTSRRTITDVDLPEDGEVAPARTRARAQGKKARQPKPPATPRECICGCGGQTKGGRFIPGHDAKLKGRLRRGEGPFTDAQLGYAEERSISVPASEETA